MQSMGNNVSPKARANNFYFAIVGDESDDNDLAAGGRRRIPNSRMKRKVEAQQPPGM